MSDDAIGCIDWSEAFDVCRERNRPLRVMDRDGSVTQIFPSGAEKPLADNASIDAFIAPPED